jgi:hypothetical protein
MLNLPIHVKQHIAGPPRLGRRRENILVRSGVGWGGAIENLEMRMYWHVFTLVRAAGVEIRGGGGEGAAVVQSRARGQRAEAIRAGWHTRRIEHERNTTRQGNA